MMCVCCTELGNGIGIGNSNSGAKCIWCGNESAKMKFQTDKNGKEIALCSERCFTQMRHTSFKKIKQCDWCHSPRQTLTFVDFQDGDQQLQFCGEQCLNHYKMQIFCRETQEHLKQIQLQDASSNGGTISTGIQQQQSLDSNGGDETILITPELWNSNEDQHRICRHKDNRATKKKTRICDQDTEEDEDKPLDLKVKPSTITSLTNTCKLAVKRKLTAESAARFANRHHDLPLSSAMSSAATSDLHMSRSPDVHRSARIDVTKSGSNFLINSSKITDKADMHFDKRRNASLSPEGSFSSKRRSDVFRIRDEQTESPSTAHSNDSQLFWSPVLSIPYMAQKLSLAATNYLGSSPRSDHKSSNSAHHHHNGSFSTRQNKISNVTSQLSCPLPKTSEDIFKAMPPLRSHSQPDTLASPLFVGISPSPDDQKRLHSRYLSNRSPKLKGINSALSSGNVTRSHSQNSPQSGSSSSSSNASTAGLLPPYTLLVPYPFPIPVPIPIPIPIFLKGDGKEDAASKHDKTTAAVSAYLRDRCCSEESTATMSSACHLPPGHTDSVTGSSDQCHARIVCACCQPKNKESLASSPVRGGGGSVCVKQERTSPEMDDEPQSNGESTSPISADIDVDHREQISLLRNASQALATLTNPRYVARRNLILDAPSQPAEEYSSRSTPSEKTVSFESYQLWLRDMHQRGKIAKSKTHSK